MYEKCLEQLEEAGKIRNLKERSINCYKNYVSYFLKYQNKNPEELACQDVRTFLLAKKASYPRPCGSFILVWPIGIYDIYSGTY